MPDASMHVETRVRNAALNLAVFFAAFVVTSSAATAIFHSRWFTVVDVAIVSGLFALVPTAIVALIIFLRSYASGLRRDAASGLLCGGLCAASILLFTTDSDLASATHSFIFSSEGDVASAFIAWPPVAGASYFEVYRNRLPFIGLWRWPIAQPPRNQLLDADTTLPTTRYYEIIAIVRGHRELVGWISSVKGFGSGPWTWLATRPISFVVVPLVFGELLYRLTREPSDIVARASRPR